MFNTFNNTTLPFSMWTVSISNKYCLIVSDLSEQQSMCLPSFGGGKENSTKHTDVIHTSATTFYIPFTQKMVTENSKSEWIQLDRIANRCEIALLPPFSSCARSSLTIYSRYTKHSFSYVSMRTCKRYKWTQLILAVLSMAVLLCWFIQWL